MLAMREKIEIQSLKSEPGSKPKAIPGFSVNVILKKSPSTEIDSPGYIPLIFKFKKGMFIPLI
jgi:hypothetical protein